MGFVALAIIGLAVLLVFVLGSRDGPPGDAPPVIPSAKIYDVYGDVIAPNKGDSDATKDKKKKLRAKLGELENEVKRAEALRAAWENKRTDKKEVFDTFKKHGNKIAACAEEAKALYTQLTEG